MPDGRTTINGQGAPDDVGAFGTGQLSHLIDERQFTWGQDGLYSGHALEDSSLCSYYALLCARTGLTISCSKLPGSCVPAGAGVRPQSQHVAYWPPGLTSLARWSRQSRTWPLLLEVHVLNEQLKPGERAGIHASRLDFGQTGGLHRDAQESRRDSAQVG